MPICGYATWLFYCKGSQSPYFHQLLHPFLLGLNRQERSCCPDKNLHLLSTCADGWKSAGISCHAKVHSLLQHSSASAARSKDFQILTYQSSKLLKSQGSRYCMIWTFEFFWAWKWKLMKHQKPKSTVNQSGHKVSQKPKTVSTKILSTEEESRLHSYHRKAAVN